MDLNITQIKNHFFTAYQMAAEKAGLLAGRVIKAVDPVIIMIRQDARASAALFGCANILFIHTAMLVAELADWFFIKLLGPEDKISDSTRSKMNFADLVIAASWIVGGNVALAKLVEPKLSPAMVATVSTVSCVSYLLFGIWKAAYSEAKQLDPAPVDPAPVAE